ncbi:MAG: flavodoxin-dependent (E)-4-hydroxy-3-methylbut-2-enyl-diphosphate synthase, partial [Verrucomicrobiota bacterium]|nr:flavodoxin-dependent (E)-4-hydroxy-3-methylbut-2-enyl-diphosphate synthase [Verrucomicrobiota bacterium]
MGTASPYCASRYHSIRRQSHAVRVGDLSVGGENPIRVQSMTTTDTLDVEATVRQTLELAEAGCE